MVRYPPASQRGCLRRSAQKRAGILGLSHKVPYEWAELRRRGLTSIPRTSRACGIFEGVPTRQRDRPSPRPTPAAFRAKARRILPQALGVGPRSPRRRRRGNAGRWGLAPKPRRLFVHFEAGAVQVGVSQVGTAHRAIRLALRFGPRLGCGASAARAVASICLWAQLLGSRAPTPQAGVLGPQTTDAALGARPTPGAKPCPPLPASAWCRTRLSKTATRSSGRGAYIGCERPGSCSANAPSDRSVLRAAPLACHVPSTCGGCGTRPRYPSSMVTTPRTASAACGFSPNQ